MVFSDSIFALQSEDVPVQTTLRILLDEHFQIAEQTAQLLVKDDAVAERVVLDALIRAVQNRSSFMGQVGVRGWIFRFVVDEASRHARPTGPWKRLFPSRRKMFEDLAHFLNVHAGMTSEEIAYAIRQPKHRFKGVRTNGQPVESAEPLQPEVRNRLLKQLEAMLQTRPQEPSRQRPESWWVLGLAVILMVAIVLYQQNERNQVGVILFPQPLATPMLYRRPSDRLLVQVYAPTNEAEPAASKVDLAQGNEFSFFVPQPYDAYPEQQVMLIQDDEMVDASIPLASQNSLSTREFFPRTGVFRHIPSVLPEDAKYLGQRNTSIRVVSVYYSLPLTEHQELLLTIHVPTGFNGAILLPEDLPDRRVGSRAVMEAVDLSADPLVTGELVIGGWLFTTEGTVGITLDRDWVILDGQVRWVNSPERMTMRWAQEGMLFELQVIPLPGLETDPEASWITPEEFLAIAADLVEVLANAGSRYPDN